MVLISKFHGSQDAFLYSSAWGEAILESRSVLHVVLAKDMNISYWVPLSGLGSVAEGKSFLVRAQAYARQKLCSENIMEFSEERVAYVTQPQGDQKKM